MNISLFNLKKFNFGNRIIYQFVVLEIKQLFGICFFYFTKSDQRQDRYHTHAFNAVSFKFFGQYNEYVLLDEKMGSWAKYERKEIIKYFPRDSYHCIGESPKGCLTLLLYGPWHKTWKEYKNGKVRQYTWNRKEV